ncbi:uncharacterized protein LOC108207083 [Daucus carota subsp. sativus]|uniref:uncharacterized protein LOC108207083 n=1 Tax=Daucus carota subsp. sativus TaxID=79200 RepID=UPI0007EF708F|nr:PREDICTED: uncharacterized protein LOC108207083 [Daucus carota subsp. sativus]
MACIQKTRWKEEKTKEANGFISWYSGLVNSHNGVGILLSTKLKDKVVEIKRFGDRIIIPLDQFLFVGGDFNGHIGARADGYQGVHGGFGYDVRNDNGSTLLEFATAHDLVIVNSCFCKRDDNLITFRSGEHATQIDYLLIHSMDFRFCSDCKVFLMEACASQHRLLAMDLSLDGPPMEGLRVVEPKILWRNLHGSKVAEFKDMFEGCFR